MNQVSSENKGDPAIADSHHGRLDERQRAIVDQGVRLQLHGNSIAAFEFLKGRDVDSRIIQRVLLDPQRRRSLE